MMKIGLNTNTFPGETLDVLIPLAKDFRDLPSGTLGLESGAERERKCELLCLLG